MTKSSKTSFLEYYHTQKQLLNKIIIGQILLSEPVTDAVRKVLKKMEADSKINNEEIYNIIYNEVLKREILDGEKATEAKKKVAKALKSATKSSTPKEQAPEG